MHAQDDLNLCILRMFEGTFSLDAAHMVKRILNDLITVFVVRIKKLAPHYQEFSYYRNCHSGYRYSILD